MRVKLKRVLSFVAAVVICGVSCVTSWFSVPVSAIGVFSPFLFVLDEAQVLFDSRQWADRGRMPWNIFFSMHRHYKCHFILITQSINNLDRRIRSNVEYQYQHVNVKHATRVTHLLFGLLPDFLFLANRFYGGGKERIGSEWILRRKKYTNLYNTYDRENLSVKKEG